MNDGSQVPNALNEIRTYVIGLEKKYALLGAVIQDVCDFDENISVGEAIEALYSVTGKEIPEEVQERLDKL